jgi:hypothetical protein
MVKNFVHFAGKIARCLLPPVSLLLLATACHKEQVQVYQANQDQTAQPAAATAPASNAAPSDLPPSHPDISAPDNSSMSAQSMPAGVVAPDISVPPVAWTTPTNWNEVPPSEMRVGSFKIAGANGAQADVSIIPLSGMAGGDFANVNRWRGQVALPPQPDDVLQNSAETVQAGGQPAQLYDIAGINSMNGETNRIIGVIQHRDGTTWFFKMTGDDSLVEQQKPVLVDFLKTLSFGSLQTQAQLPPGHPAIGDMEQTLPPGHPAISDMNASTETGPISHEGQPHWQVPGAWQEVSGGQFLVAKFVITWIDGWEASVNVSSSDGDGGGLAPNVNRWRGQLGLPPQDEIPTTSFSVSRGQAQLVDLPGTNAQTGQPAELVGVVVTQPDRTWFYKLMGHPAVVAAQKNAFTTFVKGVQY